MADVRLTATNPEDSSVVPVACNERGELRLEEIPDQSFDGNLDGDLNVTGDIYCGERVAASYYFATYNPELFPDAAAQEFTMLYCQTLGGGRLHALYANGDAYFDGQVTVGNGGATFAGNKAGITAEGYLWCTTRRGDTVILDFTSNGMGMWEPYTPPSRREEIKDRLPGQGEILEKWSEKNVLRPKPEESSQD